MWKGRGKGRGEEICGVIYAFDEDSSNGMSLPASPWMAAKTSPAAARSSNQRQEVSPVLQQIGGDAGPVEVHVHGSGSRQGVIGEPALQFGDLVEAETGSAEFSRNCGQQVTKLPSSSQSSSKNRFSRS